MNRTTHRWSICKSGRLLTALLGTTLALLATGPAAAQQAKSWLPDAIIEQMEIRLQVTPDGRLETRQFRRIRLMSPMAFHQLADPRFLVDREFEELAIETARVLLPDGRMVDVPNRAKTLTTPDAVAQAPSFSQYSEWVVSMLGVEPGATLELQWVVRDRLKRRDYYEGVFVLGDRFPIQQATFSLELPARLPLELLALLPNGDPIPQQEPQHKAATTVYSWRLEQIPAAGGLPETAIYRFPFVAFSTAGGWEKLLQPAVKRIEEAAAVTGQSMLALLEPQGAGPQGVDRWISLVQGLSNRMRRVPQEVASPTLPLRDLATVWRLREATPFEMAQLTVCLLRAAGAPARLSLYLPWLGPPETLPSAMQLVSNYRIEIAGDEGPTLRFAPFATEPDSAPPALLGGGVCTLPQAGPIRVVPSVAKATDPLAQGDAAASTRAATPPAVLAGLWVTLRAKLKGSTLQMELQLRASGMANPWFRWNRLFAESAAKAALADMLIPGATIESVAVKSWGPAGSELVATGSVALPKGASVIDLGPLSNWLEPLVQSRLDPTAPPCPNCQVLYSSRVVLEGKGLSLAPTLASQPCAQALSSCVGATTAQTENGAVVSREFRAALGDEPGLLRGWLARFLADNRVRRVVVFAP